jgi:hypothetical protein
MKILLALLPKKYKEYVALGLTIAEDLSDDGYMTKKNWLAIGKKAGFIK